MTKPQQEKIDARLRELGAHIIPEYAESTRTRHTIKDDPNKMVIVYNDANALLVSYGLFKLIERELGTSTYMLDAEYENHIAITHNVHAFQDVNKISETFKTLLEVEPRCILEYLNKLVGPDIDIQSVNLKFGKHPTKHDVMMVGDLDHRTIKAIDVNTGKRLTGEKFNYFLQMSMYHRMCEIGMAEIEKVFGKKKETMLEYFDDARNNKVKGKPNVQKPSEVDPKET